MTRAAPTSELAPKPADGGLISSLTEAGKPGITRLVTITSLVGFVLAALGHSWHLLELAIAAIGCGAGTALCSFGANTLNQWIERDRDALMRRTAHRPLPQRRLAPRTALIAGVVQSLLGLLVLLALTNTAATLVSLACLITYLAVYTPLKVRSEWSTLIGAIPGALPPMIGWAAGAAVTNGSETWPAWLTPLAGAGGWSLFLLMAVWQLPHFYAIAWMYRDDYSIGGYKVLAAADPTGIRTARGVFFWSLALIPATMLPMFTMPTLIGWPYALVALGMGLAFLTLGIRFLRTRSREAARAVFLASIAHLPILLLVLVAEAVVRTLVL